MFSAKPTSGSLDDSIAVWAGIAGCGNAGPAVARASGFGASSRHISETA
jgi:hypothetical protein